MCCMLKPSQKGGASTSEVTIIGIDQAKPIFFTCSGLVTTDPPYVAQGLRVASDLGSCLGVCGALSPWSRVVPREMV